MEASFGYTKNKGQDRKGKFEYACEWSILFPLSSQAYFTKNYDLNNLYQIPSAL